MFRIIASASTRYSSCVGLSAAVVVVTQRGGSSIVRAGSGNCYQSWLTRTSRTALLSTQTTTSGDGQPPVFDKIAMIGTGKMSQAIIAPLIKTGLQPADKIHVFDVSTSLMDQCSDKFGVQTTNSIPELITGADIVICAVKPQNLNSKFWAELRKGIAHSPSSSSDAIFLSIVAGKYMSDFEEGGYEKIVRSMPNTPAIIGQGMTVWSCTPNLTATDRIKVESILSSFGESMYVDDEQYVDMATSINGSGPAYIFLLMESLIDGAVHMGFPREKATTLVYHTMLGSTVYAMESGEHPAILRNMVTSPGGTTASALYELERGKIRTVIKDAMWACYRRSLEMGGRASNVGPGRTHFPVSLVDAKTDDDDDDNRREGRS